MLIYHRLAHAKFEAPVGFEAAKRKLSSRLKGIKRACFPSLATVESRLERLCQLSVRLLQVKWVMHTLALLLIGGAHEAVFGGVHRVGTVEHHGPTAVPAISNNCHEEAVDVHQAGEGEFEGEV